MVMAFLATILWLWLLIGIWTGCEAIGKRFLGRGIYTATLCRRPTTGFRAPNAKQRQDTEYDKVDKQLCNFDPKFMYEPVQGQGTAI